MADVYDIAASGMAAQRTQMNLIAENLANAGVVRADGGIFRARTAVFENAATFSGALGRALDTDDQIFDGPSLSDEASDGPAGVAVSDIVTPQTAPQFRYDPGNPYAQRTGAHKGYVALPDIDPIEQMISLVGAGRAYDADVAMLQAAKQMDTEAADIGRA